MGINAKKFLLLGAAICCTSTSAIAADVYYSDYAVWQAAVASAGLVEETLDFTRANVLLSDEVTSLPTGLTTQQFLGPTLTFDGTNTGLSRNFELAMEPTNGDLVWNDITGGSNAYGADVVSLGNINQDENDDAILRFTNGGVRAVGMFIVANDASSSEFFGIYDTLTADTGIESAARSVETVTANLPNGVSEFIGVVTDDPFLMAQFDESTNGDDAGIRGITYGIVAVPEPNSLAALAVCGAGFVAGRRRRS